MKKFFSKVLLIATVLGFGTSVFADDIRLGVPGYGGTGCPGGTASVTLSPDAKALSILFDQYVAESGGATGKSIDRKTCNVAIPVHIPQGFSVSIFKVDYRGYAAVPHGAEGQFNVEYFFAGIRGPKFTKTFPGGTDREYTLSNNIGVSALVWSRCGEDVNLRINTSALSKTNGSFADTMISVDSADVTAGLVYHLQWRRC